mmetsp:Transcript_11233/g.31838  ORF Transcript_11233/g.31838 Transcript_11233/m.31838 type:complete len:94 (-) Transcript_11233:379-660(-)
MLCLSWRSTAPSGSIALFSLALKSNPPPPHTPFLPTHPCGWVPDCGVPQNGKCEADKEAAHDRFQRLQVAYEVLKDPKRRRAYLSGHFSEEFV